MDSRVSSAGVGVNVFKIIQVLTMLTTEVSTAEITALPELTPVPERLLL